MLLNVADLPIVLTPAGRQPTPPATLLAELIAAVSATNPGYTSNLPGSLVRDISTTEVGGLAVCDSAVTELINSITPLGANAFLLLQLGRIYLGEGAAPAPPSNTSVSVVFSGTSSQAGFVLAQGFTVSDGIYNYVVQDGGVIGSGGTSLPLFCLASIPGSWVVPANTVQNLVTSLPPGITLTVNNQVAGTPGGAAETEEQFRARVLQAGLAVSQGMPSTLRTYLLQVPGVQARLINPVQQPGGWEIIVGGSGDPYQIANAIYTALFDISTLVGSTLAVTGVTQANPGVVTTNLNHGFTTGRTGVEITGMSGMTALNGVSLTVTVIDEKRFSVGIDTSGYPAWVSGGVVTPNLRNVVVSLNDYPNIYAVPFVNPPSQTVGISVTWNTSSPNFVNSAAVALLGAPALVDYVNSIVVGAAMNLFEMQAVFQAAIASVLAPSLLTRLVFSVSINGVGVVPLAGTGIFVGDPESYFAATSSSVSVIQG